MRNGLVLRIARGAGGIGLNNCIAWCRASDKASIGKRDERRYVRQNEWSKRLTAFKQVERPQAVLLVAGSSQLTRIVVAWMNMEVSRAKRPSGFTGSTDDEAWRWLWENTQYSREELMTRIPGADSCTQKRIDALIANRVLYPDGTANSFVEKYLREKVVKLFGGKSRRNRKAVA